MIDISPPVTTPRRFVFRIGHLVVLVWLAIWSFLIGYFINPWYGVLMIPLLLPLYWQNYIVIKEDIYELRERAGVSREPTTGKTTDAQGDKPERQEE